MPLVSRESDLRAPWKIGISKSTKYTSLLRALENIMPGDFSRAAAKFRARIKCDYVFFIRFHTTCKWISRWIVCEYTYTYLQPFLLTTHEFHIFLCATESRRAEYLLQITKSQIRYTSQIQIQIRHSKRAWKSCDKHWLIDVYKFMNNPRKWIRYFDPRYLVI